MLSILTPNSDLRTPNPSITDIEVKINSLKANKNSLENQLIVEKDKLKNEIAIALLNLEESRERIKLINQKKKKVNLQSQVFLIKYSNGEGTTNQYLNYQENIDRLDFELLQATTDYRQNISKLMLLVE
jgi:outer membrane protein TolC